MLRLAGFAAVLSLGAGCSGVNASQNVSPASFFLPGLLQTDPPPAYTNSFLLADEPIKERAQF